MANHSTSTIHVKQEDLREEPSPHHDIKKEEETGSAEASPILDEESLVPLRPAQASQRPFPPHCPVLCVTPTMIAMGTVEAVFIDISSTTRKFLYRIRAVMEGTFIATEDQLQYGPSCPVWASLTASLTQESPCVVVTSHQKTRQSDPLFTLSAIDDGSLHHGVPMCCIRYRPEDMADGISSTNQSQQERHSVAIITPFIDTSDDKQFTKPSLDTVFDNETYFTEHVGAQEERTAPSFVTTDGGEKLSAKRSLDTVINSDTIASQGRQKKQNVGPREHLERNVALFELRPDYSKEGVSQKTMVASENDLTVKQLPNNRHEERSSRVSDRDQADVVDESHKQSKKQQMTDFFIPREVFGVDRVKELRRLQRNNHSIRELFKRNQLYDDPDVKGIYVELTGATQHGRDKASSGIEKIIVEGVDEDKKERALYLLALRNRYRRSAGHVVQQHLGEYGSKTNPKKWMTWKLLPSDYNDYIGLVIGKGGKNKKRIMKETGCSISIDTESDDPHYFIYGDTADDVVLCSRKMKQSIQDAKEEVERRSQD